MNRTALLFKKRFSFFFTRKSFCRFFMGESVCFVVLKNITLTTNLKYMG